MKKKLCEEKNNPIKIDHNFDVTTKDMTTCENMCQAWNETLNVVMEEDKKYTYNSETELTKWIPSFHGKK